MFLWHPHRLGQEDVGAAQPRQSQDPSALCFCPNGFPQCGGHWPSSRRSGPGMVCKAGGTAVANREAECSGSPFSPSGTEQTRPFSSRPLLAQHFPVRHDADHAAWRLLPSIRPDRPSFMSCSSLRLPVRRGPQISKQGPAVGSPQCPKGADPDAVPCCVPCPSLVHTTPPAHPADEPDGGS